MYRSYVGKAPLKLGGEHVATRTITWAKLAECSKHPLHGQLADYVAWKRRESGR